MLSQIWRMWEQHSLICRVLPTLLPTSPSKHLVPGAEQTPQLMAAPEARGRATSLHPGLSSHPSLERQSSVLVAMPRPFPAILASLPIGLSNPCARDQENTREGMAVVQPCQEAGLSLSGPDLAIFPPKGLQGHSQGQCHGTESYEGGG